MKEAITLPRRFALLLAMILMAAAGFAQVPTAGNVFLGYTLNHADVGWGTTGNLSGWELSAEGKVAPFVGIVGDLGATYGSTPIPTADLFGGTGNTSTQTRVVTFMVGPRASFSVGKFRPFAQVLVGGAHLHQVVQYKNDYSYGQSDWTDAFGGGVDYQIRSRIAVRVQGDDLQTRFHNDYPMHPGRKDNARISAGIVLKF